MSMMYKLTFLLSTFLLFSQSLISQDTRVDNQKYWKDMAELELATLNPESTSTATNL